MCRQGKRADKSAVLSRRQVIFRGNLIELMQAIQGHIWMLTTSATQKPNHDLIVVSMLHLVEGVQYRLVGSSMTDFPEAKLT